MTEEIISDLSNVHSLRVISRNTAMVYKGTRKATRTIGRELDIQYVLEGSVRKAGDKLRITAQLIDAINDTHLWAHKYSGTLDDVFDIQEKVSRSIVDALKVKLSPEESRKITERPIDDINAYDCFLRARQAILQLSEEGLQRALQLIQTGLNIIGENEILSASLGYVYVQFVNVGVSLDEKYLEKAEENVKKAFSININSSLAHSVMGQIHWKRGEIQEAVKEFKRALEIDPNSPEALYWLAWMYQFSGKVTVARPLLEKLIEIDPLTAVLYLMLGNCDLFMGKFEDSLQNYHKAIQMEKKNPLCRFVYARALIAVQKLEEAFRVIDLMTEDMPQEIFTELGLFYKYALQKEKSKRMEPISDKLKNYAARDEMISIFLAECYALINEKEEAITLIEHGVRWGFINYPFLDEHDKLLDNIRGETRFKKLMERVEHEWENYEV
jgi:tetratricopeptide (TPR) repeat protein